MLVLLEAATVTSAVLILFGRTKRAIRATYIYLAISIFEVILVIYGAFILYSCTGTLDLRYMDISLLSSGDITLLALLFLFGFGTKARTSSSWKHLASPLPMLMLLQLSVQRCRVYSSRPALFAMVKVMYPFFLITNGEMLMFIVTFFGTLNMVLGGVMALFSCHIKRLLAWSSISQIGYIIVGFGLATPVAIYGSLFHILNHMLFKGSLFLISGVLLYQVHTLQIKKDGRAWKGHATYCPISFLVASLAMSGVPFLNGFISKELIYEGSIDAGFPVIFSLLGLHFTVISILGWVTSIVIFVTLMRAFYQIFLGTPREPERELHDPPLYMIIPIVIMVMLCVVIGLFPNLVSGTLEYIAQVLFQMKG